MPEQFRSLLPPKRYCKPENAHPDLCKGLQRLATISSLQKRQTNTSLKRGRKGMVLISAINDGISDYKDLTTVMLNNEYQLLSLLETSSGNSTYSVRSLRDARRYETKEYRLDGLFSKERQATLKKMKRFLKQQQSQCKRVIKIDLLEPEEKVYIVYTVEFSVQDRLERTRESLKESQADDTLQHRRRKK